MVALIRKGDEEVIGAFAADGVYKKAPGEGWDLVNVRQTHEFWVNIYRTATNVAIKIHDTYKSANAGAKEGRIALKRVQYHDGDNDFADESAFALGEWEDTAGQYHQLETGR